MRHVIRAQVDAHARALLHCPCAGGDAELQREIPGDAGADIGGTKGAVAIGLLRISNGADACSGSGADGDGSSRERLTVARAARVAGAAAVGGVGVGVVGLALAVGRRSSGGGCCHGGRGAVNGHHAMAPGEGAWCCVEGDGDGSGVITEEPACDAGPQYRHQRSWIGITCWPRQRTSQNAKGFGALEGGGGDVESKGVLQHRQAGDEKAPVASRHKAPLNKRAQMRITCARN